MKVSTHVRNLRQVLVDGAGEVGQKLSQKRALLETVPSTINHHEMVSIINQLPLNNTEKGLLLREVLLDLTGGERPSKKELVEAFTKKGNSKAKAERLADAELYLSEREAARIFAILSKIGNTKVRAFTRTIHTSTRV